MPSSEMNGRAATRRDEAGSAAASYWAVDRRVAVTVVIPTHNRCRLLHRALDSVLAQDVCVEVVVVDDGGSDGSSVMVHELGLENVEVLRHESSRGVSAARNAGLERVRTPWVAFVDDDDVWAPTKLRRQLEALSQLPSASWSCVDAVHVDSDLSPLGYNRLAVNGDLPQEIVRRNPIPGGGSGLLVRSDVARAIGGFDEAMSILADWDFNLRLSIESPVAAVDSVLVGYYVHTDSMYHDPHGVLRELAYLERKHARLPAGKRFEVQRGPWLVDLAGMAWRTGDRTGAAHLLVRALKFIHSPFVARGMAALIRQVVRPRVPTVARDDEVEEWLLHLRTLAVGPLESPPTG